MRTRGQKYWAWASVDLHVRNHDERLPDGSLINVQVRHCPQVGAQLFVGVYGEKGVMLFEEVYDSRPGETMTQATEWGIERARKLIADSGRGKTPTVKPEPLPRKGPRANK